VVIIPGEGFDFASHPFKVPVMPPTNRGRLMGDPYSFCIIPPSYYTKEMTQNF